MEIIWKRKYVKQYWGCLTRNLFHSPDVFAGSALEFLDMYAAIADCPYISKKDQISASVSPVYSSFLTLRYLWMGPALL